MIYIDNNATNPVHSRVVEAMNPFWSDAFANPSSPYTSARRAAAAMDEARGRVARLIGAESATITFGGGGTESNALALLGSLGVCPGRRGIVISAVEHACVHETALALADVGYRVSLIPIDSAGLLDLDAAKRLIGSDTAFVSVMLANNESGVIHPVAQVAKMARAAGAVMHCDAVQAAGKIPVRVGDLGVDLLSLCAHKMHGPKGVGALYVRSELAYSPPVRGGDQEFGRRAGTENVPGIVGFGVAAELAQEALAEAGCMLRGWRDALETRVLKELTGVELVGRDRDRLPNTSLFLIEGVESEALLARLDMEGFCASSGSACASGAAEPSRVLREMGLARAGWGALRISTSRFNTGPDMDSLVGALILIVASLRKGVR